MIIYTTRETFFLLPLRHAPYFSLLFCLLHPHELCTETLRSEEEHLTYSEHPQTLQYDNLKTTKKGDFFFYF